MSSVSDVTSPGASAEAGAKTGLFVRKSSGLVREIGIRDAFSIATGGINPTNNIVVIYVLLAFASNTDLTVPFIIGAIILLPVAFTYAQLVATMPRSGGDYIYSSRLLHPAVGAFIGTALMLDWMYLAAGGAVAVGQLLLPQFFQILGSAVGAHSLATFGGTLASSHWWQFATTAIVVLLSGFFVARGGRATGRAVWWCYVAGLIAVVFLVINAFTHNGADFQAAYNHATNANAYSQVIASAHASGIKTGSTFSGLLLVLPFVVLFYNGFSQNNLPAGELKRPAKTYLRATLLCLAAAGVLMIVSWLALIHLTGMTFMQAASALSQGNPTAWAHVTGGAAFTGSYYGALLGSPVVRIIIAGGFLLGSLVNPIAVTFVSSRVMFALSFDRLIPTRLADVSERSHMPVNAAVLATAIVMLFAAVTIFSSSIALLLRNALLMTLFIFIVSSFAAAILPFRRKDLFDSSPKILSQQIGRVPLISLVAAVSIGVLGWLFYETATNPSLSGGYSVSSVATLAGIGVVGVLAYAISRTYLRQAKGVNIDLAMKELPPD